jgi:hypothetical protein
LCHRPESAHRARKRKPTAACRGPRVTSCTVSLQTVWSRSADASLRGATAMRCPVTGWSAVFAIVVVGCSLGCATRSARPVLSATASTWETVVALPPGSHVRVETSGGLVLAGRLVGAASDGVTVSTEGELRRLSNTDVLRLFRAHRRTAEKAKRGLIVGMAAGAVVSKAGKATAGFTAFIVASWGGIGALIGATDGVFDRREAAAIELSPCSLRSSSTGSMAGARRADTKVVAVLTDTIRTPTALHVFGSNGVTPYSRRGLSRQRHALRENARSN